MSHRLRFFLAPFLALGLSSHLPAQATNAASPATAAVHATAAPNPHADADLDQREVVFGKGGDHDLHAEIAVLKNAKGPMPAFIWIHGGGWIGGSEKETGEIKREARRGYFCASIEYRLSNVAKWPAQIEDCKLAVRWMRANAAKFDVDPNRIGVGGGSAGGHLVACLGTMADVKADEGDGGYPGVSSAVQAVVDYFGPTDFVTPGIYSPGAISLTEKLFGVPFAQDPALWKSGSPLFYVKAGGPPFLIIHGNADTLVPIAQSTALAAALTKAGVPNQLLVVQNAGHGLRPLPGKKIDPDWKTIHATADAFLDKYLKNPAP